MHREIPGSAEATRCSWKQRRRKQDEERGAVFPSSLMITLPPGNRCQAEYTGI
jgi:hypothetical protein